MVLAHAKDVTFAYPGGRSGLEEASLTVAAGEIVLVLGASGAGKSTLLRALAGLVPHFHGGRFGGRVEVAGLDTRSHRPAELAGRVATLFQDPEDQVVMTGVDAEVAFGLENVGVPSAAIPERVEAALAAVGIGHLAGRSVTELSGGELQRVCLAAVLALEPELLLLDEPTSQLDPDAADALLELVCRLARERGTAVVLSEQRPALPLGYADRVVFLDRGRIVLDAARHEALGWLRRHRPAFVQAAVEHAPHEPGELVCRLEEVAYSYGDGPPAVDGETLELRRGEVVALTGPNGSGKTTLARLAAGLLEPGRGRVVRSGRAAYLSQDPGRYLVRERADEEVALGVGGDLGRARLTLASMGLAGYEARHPRDLSSGERERLALAAVLVTEPDLLVLDEPTRGVDPERKLELAGALRAAAPGRATLVVTHDVAFAAAVADRSVSLAGAQERARV